MKTRKLYTLIFVVNGGKVLLGRKKRGFAAGKYNGFGGKLENNETLEQCAFRELKEEANIEANDLKALGYVTFDYSDFEYVMQVYVYLVTSFNGIPAASDEMEPKWFSLRDIPYELMLDDSKYWVPSVLKGQSLRGYFRFNNEKEIVEKEILLHTHDVRV